MCVLVAWTSVSDAARFFGKQAPLMQRDCMRGAVQGKGGNCNGETAPGSSNEEKPMSNSRLLLFLSLAERFCHVIQKLLLLSRGAVQGLDPLENGSGVNLRDTTGQFIPAGWSIGIMDDHMDRCHGFDGDHLLKISGDSRQIPPGLRN